MAGLSDASGTNGANSQPLLPPQQGAVQVGQHRGVGSLVSQIKKSPRVGVGTMKLTHNTTRRHV